MAERKETYYDVLGVPRNAKRTDITRAYNRHKSEVTRDDAAPDMKREALIREAYETLTDEDRRAAYDQSLVAPARRHRSRSRAVIIGSIGVVIAGSYLVFMRPSQPPVAAARPSQEILNDTAISIGALQAIDMSGQVANAGMVFVIGENIVVGTCRDVSPTAQVVVKIPPLEVPARVLNVEPEWGICRLLARGIGSRPLDPATTEAKAGDLVYAAKLDEAGKLSLAQGTVKRVLFEQKARVTESAAVGPAGGPLLDAQGRLIGMATAADGRYIPVPATWLTEARQPFREERFTLPVPEPAPTASGGPPQPANTKALENLTPDQRQRLEKAYRPPPDTKDDWMK